MSNDLPGMEQRIIDSAIACIEKYGFQNATVRRIAEEAGVNVAAINYYFRSKELLIQRVMEITLDNAFDWSDFEGCEDLAPKPRLAAILEHIVAGAQAYPEITRAHFYDPFVTGKPDATVVKRTGDFLEHIYQDLRQRGAQPDGRALRFAVLQAFSALLSVGMLPNMFSGFIGEPLDDPAVRKAFIDSLVDRVLTGTAQL